MVAGLAAVVGLVAGVAVIVRGVTAFADRVEGFDRAIMPTTLEVEITEPGGYSIYHEYDGFSSVDVRSDPDVEVIDPSGRDVFLRSYEASVTYDISGHDGVGLYTFRADEPGTYEVEASMPFDSGNDLIAVGPGVGRGLALSIVAGIALIGIGIVGGIVVAIVVGILRGRSRRAAMPVPAMGWAPPPGPWGAPAWPPGAYPPPPAPPSPYPPPPAPPPPEAPQDAPARDAAPTNDV